MTVDGLASHLHRARRIVKTPWPALDELLHLELGRKRFAVLALPHAVGPEIPYLFAHAAVRAGGAPLCVAPSWPTAWDGGLNVLRVATLAPQTIAQLDQRRPKPDFVIVDQFSRMYWEDSPSGAEREVRVNEAGKSLLQFARGLDIPVVVFPRWKSPVQPLSVAQLHSDGALECDSDCIAMLHPAPEAGSATFHMIKDRTGPAPYTTTIAWPDTSFPR